MIVFKLYFKLFFKRIGIILLYSAIFVGITLLIMSSSNNKVTSFEATETRVAFYDEDNTELTKGLKLYLDRYASFVEVEDNLLDEAFFYRDVQYVIKIPKGFTSKFLTDDQLKIERRLIPDETTGYFIDGKINNYLGLAYTYLNNDLADLSDVSSKIIADTLNETNVLFPEVEIKDFRYLGIYFNNLGYVLIVLIVTVSGLVITSFTSFEVRRRNTIGAISNNKFNLAIISGTIITSLMFLILFGLLAYILSPDLIITNTGLLMILNVLIFILPIISLSFLITNLTKNKMLITGLATVISLGAAFLSGAFIPQALLSDSVLNISKVFPLYYLISNNELLTSNSFSYSDFYLNLVLMIMFAVLYTAIALFVSRRKMKAES